MKVLIIEDDVLLNSTVTDFLILKNHEVTSTYDGVEAINKIDLNKYDMYIVDINIPNINGLDILKYIRQKDLISPIIIITASMELENLKEAYNNGCNEYIKKPFYLEELEIKINKITNEKINNVIQISNTIFYDTDYEELFINGQTVKLRKKERRLLYILLKNLNKTVSSEKLESYVWENDIREAYPLRQLVNDLRKKFNNGESYIFTDNGLGYRFEIKK